MSRAALERRQRMIASGQVREPPPVEEVAQRKNMVSMEFSGTNYNINRLLVDNIKEDPYFRSLHNKNEFQQVVDEIYNQVTHAEPWALSSARTPSRCFALLYKLLLMKVTTKQMTNLLNHGDSPFIRVVGFLYLRYTCPPAELWSWFEPHINDPLEFVPGHNKRTVTMGKFVEGLLSELKYFSTLFPRIPQQLQRQLLVMIMRKHEQIAPNENRPLQHLVETGTELRAVYREDMQWYRARVDAIKTKAECQSTTTATTTTTTHSSSIDADTDRIFLVTFLPEEEFGNQEEVSIGEIEIAGVASRAPLSTTTGSRGRARSTSPPRSKSPSRLRSVDGARDNGGSNGRREKRRSRSRSRGQIARHRHRHHRRDEDRGRSDGRSRRRDRSRDRDGRDRRGKHRSRKDRERGGGGRRSRSRSRSRSQDRGRRGRHRARSISNDDRARASGSAGRPPRTLTDEELMQQVLERERQRVATSGRDFATRVAGVKNALALNNGHNNAPIERTSAAKLVAPVASTSLSSTGTGAAAAAAATRAGGKDGHDEGDEGNKATPLSEAQRERMDRLKEKYG